MLEIVMKCIKYLPDSIVEKFVYWGIYEFARPATIRVLQELELTEWASKIAKCTDYESLTQTANEIALNFSDLQIKLKGSLTREKEAHYIRAFRSAVALGYLSRTASEKDIYNSFFAQFLEKAVFAHTQKDKSQDIIDKLQILCEEADFDLDALIRKVLEEEGKFAP